MLIRVISDLHVDINRDFPFSLKGDEKDYFTLIAGDVSGNVKETETWIKNNINKGCFIVGNHDPSYNDINWTINKQKKYLSDKFNIVGSTVKFMDIETNSITYEIPNTNILVIGSTLYTDYKFTNTSLNKYLKSFNDENIKTNKKLMTIQDLNMLNALRGLNDFKWGHVEDEKDERKLKQRLVKPQDYLTWFNNTFEQISNIVEKNPTKDIIILTHHCPSFLCISSDYVKNIMNASYCSELEEFIHSHSNIRAWICGHVHNQNIIKINDKTTIIQNPRGYEREIESLNWNPNTFIDTDTWEVVTKPYSNKKLNEARDKYNKFIKNNISLFMI